MACIYWYVVAQLQKSPVKHLPWYIIDYILGQDEDAGLRPYDTALLSSGKEGKNRARPAGSDLPERFLCTPFFKGAVSSTDEMRSSAS